MLTVWQLSACWLCMLNQHVYFFSGQPSVKTSVLSWSRRSTKWTWTLERFVVTVVGGVNKPWMLLSEENEPSMVNWRWKVTRALDTRKRAQRRFFQRGRTAMFVVMVTPFGQRQRRTTCGPAVPLSCHSNMMPSFISSTNCTAIKMKEALCHPSPRSIYYLSYSDHLFLWSLSLCLFIYLSLQYFLKLFIYSIKF